MKTFAVDQLHLFKIEKHLKILCDNIQMKPIDYSKTVMYKLVSKDLNSDLQYVGHTINFRMRKYAHKSTCNNEKDKNYNLKVYQMIRENGGWNEWVMIEIEKYPCNDKNEACKRERELMEEFNFNLNMIKSFRSKTDILLQKKQNYEKNKNLISIRRKEKRQQKKMALKLEENSVGI